MPKVNTKDMKAGDMKVFHTRKIAYLSWLDKKIVNMLTTFHKPEIVNTDKRNFITKELIAKPNAVISYNSYMGGVDLMDQSLMMFYAKLQNNITKYTFIYLTLQYSMHMLICNKHLHYETKMKHLDFRLQIVDELFDMPKTYAKKY